MSEESELSEPGPWRRYWPILVLLLLPLIPLFRAMFLGEAIGPFDQIRQMAPWNGPRPAQAWDVLQADGVLQFYVWRDLVFDAWGHWQFPFWNHYQLAGTPLMANSQSGALYPPHILMGILHLPTARAMALLAWFHLFWAGLGVYVLCRALGACRHGAFVGGATFALSTFMIAWTGLPSVIETVSWIPWVLVLTFVVFAAIPDHQALTDPFRRVSQPPGISRGAGAALALAVGMMILAGHLQFVAYGFLAGFALLVWLVVTRWRPLAKEAPHETPRLWANPVLGSTGRVVLAVVAGICIAAPQLLPVLEFSQFSPRRNVASAAGYAAYNAEAIQPYELVKMIVPTIQGNPRQIFSDQLPVSTYYPAVLRPGANFAESAIGIGAFALLLLCVLPLVAKRRDPIWGVLIAGFVGLLMAMGAPINELLYFGVPGWSSTGSPGRGICLFVLAASVGAGVAASRLHDVKALLAQRREAVYAVGGAFVLICLICIACMNSYSLRQGLNQEVVDALKAQAESSALSGAIGISVLGIAAICLLIWEQTPRSRILVGAIPVVTSIVFFGTTLIQTGKPDLTVSNIVGSQRIAPINDSWDLYRAVQGTLPPNLSALNRIHSLDGYDSLMHRDTVALLKDIDGGDPAPQVNGNMMLIKPKANIDKLAAAGVTEVWSREPMPELGEGTHEGNLYRYPIHGPGRASTPQGSAEIVAESPNQMKLRARGPGKLVVRERNMPGWLAKVDGRHVPLGGTTWMEVDLSSGEHSVELNYVPPGVTIGALLALLGWLIVLSGIAGYVAYARIGRNPGFPTWQDRQDGSKIRD